MNKEKSMKGHLAVTFAWLASPIPGIISGIYLYYTDPCFRDYWLEHYSWSERKDISTHRACIDKITYPGFYEDPAWEKVEKSSLKVKGVPFNYVRDATPSTLELETVGSDE